MSDLDSAYRANIRLKRCGVKLNYTEEQLEEYIKCSQDPIYFLTNHVKVVHVDKGEIPFDLYPFQKDMIRTIHENRRVVGRIGRQSGKCLDINTPIRLRNKATGDIIETTIGEFYENQKQISTQDKQLHDL